MSFTPEQLLATQKANVETLFDLTSKAFEGVEQLVALNLQLAKATLAEAAESAQAAFSVKDAQELLALQTSLLQPAAEKAAAYGRQLNDIVTGVNAEFSKVGEATIANTQKSLASLVDTATKNAPAGSESVMSLMKSAFTATNNAYEGLSKAAKQAAEVAEANFTTITNNAVKATQSATKAAKKTA